MEIPSWALSIGGGLGAVIAGAVVYLIRLGKDTQPQAGVTEHDCIRKGDIEAIRARLEAGNIKFTELQTKLARVQPDIENLTRNLRDVENTLSRLLGRLEG